MKLFFLVGVISACSVGLSAAQDLAPSRDAFIYGGTVVSAVTSQPLPGVHVSVRTTSAVPGPTAISDPLGRFELTIPSTIRRPQVVARKAGHSSVTATLAPDSPANIRLVPRAVISGRVMDDAGEPVVGARVSLSRVRGGTVDDTLTDDRGEYRMSVEPHQALILAVTTVGAAPQVTATPLAEERRIALPTDALSRPPTYTAYLSGATSRANTPALELEPGEERVVADFIILAMQSARQPMGALDLLPTHPFVVEENADASGRLVTGRVTDVAGVPLINARVALTSERPGAPVHLTRTDATGLFTFTNVEPGVTRVVASKPGYSPTEVRQTITTTPDPVPRLTMPLSAWAAVSGRVLDEFGEPVQGVRVRALRTQLVGARHQLVPAGAVESLTNDRGEYRLWGLSPGRYAVAATPDPTSGLVGYRRSYVFASSNTSEPAQLRLGAGEEMESAEVLLAKAGVYRVSGQVVRSSGQAGLTSSVQLLPSQRTGVAGDAPISARIQANGRFEFRDVPDGDYVIQAYRGRSDAATEGEFGALGLSVRGGDVTGLIVRTAAGSTLAGTVVWDESSTTQRPRRADIELSPVPADPDLAPIANWATTGVTADWQFFIQGLSGPRRIVATGVPRNWAVRAIRSNGVDVTDQPLAFGTQADSRLDLEVELTNRPTQLAGRITRASGSPGSATRVVAFSPERSKWYGGSRHVHIARSARDGTFQLMGLPPGGYFVAVLPTATADDSDAWFDPSVLESLLSDAIFVTLDEGDQRLVELRRP